MIIFIISAIIIIAFGVLCIMSIFKAQKEVQELDRKMRAMEENISLISRMMSKTSSAPPARKPRQIPAAERAPEQKIAAESANAAKRPAPQKPRQERAAEDAGPKDNISFEEISIEDLLGDFEDILPEFPENAEGKSAPEGPARIRQEDQRPETAKTVVSEPETAGKENIRPQRPHYDYDVGRSGKRYTASELESLIRE